MMTPFKRLHLVRTLYRSSQIGESSSYLLGCCKSYSSALSNGSEGNFRSFHPHLLKGHDGFPFAGVKSLTLRSTMAAELSIFMNDRRISTQVKASAQARQVGQQISISSPGFIYESYEPREKIPFWKRWFTRSGWRRTKNDIILDAYAIAKLRKKGYSKNQFYNEAANMYKEINTLIAKGDKRTLRKAVTENMFSALKNDIKQRDTAWSRVYWEMVEPIGVDRKDLNKTFIQLTLEILAKQKFEAYDSKGSVVAGDKSKEVLVRDIWVLEKSMFHPGATWHLCGRISPKASQLFP
ncbi:39S ribosomal protein L45, mitochondrial [Glycine soja]